MEADLSKFIIGTSYKHIIPVCLMFLLLIYLLFFSLVSCLFRGVWLPCSDLTCFLLCELGVFTIQSLNEALGSFVKLTDFVHVLCLKRVMAKPSLVFIKAFIEVQRTPQ